MEMGWGGGCALHNLIHAAACFPPQRGKERYGGLFDQGVFGKGMGHWLFVLLAFRNEAKCATPFSVIRYFCNRLLGLSGIVHSTI